MIIIQISIWYVIPYAQSCVLGYAFPHICPIFDTDIDFQKIESFKIICRALQDGRLTHRCRIFCDTISWRLALWFESVLMCNLRSHNALAGHQVWSDCRHWKSYNQHVQFTNQRYFCQILYAKCSESAHYFQQSA